MEKTDLELVRAAADGDGAAFHALVDRHAKTLFRVALSLTPTRDDAEDVLQETFAGAFKSLRNFNAQASVKTWLTRILMKQAAKQWNKGKNARKTLSIEALSESTDRLEASVATRSGVGAVDGRLDLMSIMRAMAPEHQEVLTLREIQGLAYEEIAQALDIPRGTVESRLHRARADLRERLKGYL